MVASGTRSSINAICKSLNRIRDNLMEYGISPAEAYDSIVQTFNDVDCKVIYDTETRKVFFATKNIDLISYLKTRKFNLDCLQIAPLFANGIGVLCTSFLKYMHQVTDIGTFTTQTPHNVPSFINYCKLIRTAGLPQHDKLLEWHFYVATQSLDELWNGLLADAFSQASEETPPTAPRLDAKTRLLSADTERANLPTLDQSILTDQHLGHWDLWQQNVTLPESQHPEIPLDAGYIARNPANDIQRNIPVAIDFGTTSTVVALREQGRSRLFRVGVKNWREAPVPQDFENPTLLVIQNYQPLMQAWYERLYRPHVQWAHVKCSHWAKAELTDAATCNSIQGGIANLKTWAHTQKRPMPYRDAQGHEFTIAPLQNDDRTADAFNPLELYAFFLGLNLNNQHSHGGRVYHNYHMSFPVDFDTATRQCIMQAFSQGLERSLPASLGYQEGWRTTTPFTVHEGASEPAAYAAGALPVMGLEPTNEGLPFGVFDFGGGTTDFAIGIYRTATPQEERDNGWEEVLEILDSAGDVRLGGEHLLHHLAYVVVRKNMQKMLETGAGLSFVMPDDATAFAGSELILDTGLAARTNTAKLCQALRPLWEENALDTQDTGQISLTLFDKAGQQSPLLALDVDEDALRQWLAARIRQGVEAFFTTFRQALKIHESNPSKFHVLLAGNSCRSPLVHEAFEAVKNAITDDDSLRHAITIHDVLKQNMEHPYAPTLKTGVALGLLRTMPGESMGIIDRPRARNDEAPFQFSVGSFKRNALAPVLHRYHVYNQWREFGLVRQDLTTILGYTASPLAIEGQVPRGECAEEQVIWAQEDVGKTIFICCTNPNTVELTLGPEGATEPQTQNTIKIFLKA